MPMPFDPTNGMLPVGIFRSCFPSREPRTNSLAAFLTASFTMPSGIFAIIFFSSTVAPASPSIFRTDGLLTRTPMSFNVSTLAA